MRWRFEREDLEMYKCCFCFHVRTGTLILGVINLFSHIAALSFLVLALSRPELIQQYLPDASLESEAPFQYRPNDPNWADAFKPHVVGQPVEEPILPDETFYHPGKEETGRLNSLTKEETGLLSSVRKEETGPVHSLKEVLGRNDSMKFAVDAQGVVGEKYDWSNWKYARNWNLKALIVGMILLTIASMTIALCLLYGTIKGVSKYITPFLCVQLFDLCLSGLSMLSYFSDLAAVRRTIATQPRLPFKEELLSMDNDHLTLLVLVLFISAFAIKAYFIGVVWACYKYLKLHETMGESGCQARVRIYDSEELCTADDTQMLLPPKYEDVLLMPEQQADGPPPPAYSPQ